MKQRYRKRGVDDNKSSEYVILSNNIEILEGGFMLNYIWPIGLVVLANIFYQVCAKEVPDKMDPFASLTITYLIAAVFSLILFFAINKGGNLIQEYAKMNWAPLVLGLSIVGLETGFIYAYKAGWQVSTAAIVQSSILGVALLFVGWLIYHESLNLYKLLGIAICMVGLVFINYK